MPPKLRTRSTSRSRLATPQVDNKKKKKMSTSPVKSASKSRGRPKISEAEKSARKASKSATPRKSASTRSRSRSRGRPAIVADTASSSSKKVVKTVREPKKDVVEKSHEVADDDEEEVAVSTPRLRKREVRSDTQSPPRTRSSVLKSPAQVFRDTSAASTTATKSPNVVFKTIESVFNFIIYVITWPYVQLRDYVQRSKPTTVEGTTLYFLLLTLILTIAITLMFPLIFAYVEIYSERYAVPFFKGVNSYAYQAFTYVRTNGAQLIDKLKARFDR